MLGFINQHSYLLIGIITIVALVSVVLLLGSIWITVALAFLATLGLFIFFYLLRSGSSDYQSLGSLDRVIGSGRTVVVELYSDL